MNRGSMAVAADAAGLTILFSHLPVRRNSEVSQRYARVWVGKIYN